METSYPPTATLTPGASPGPPPRFLRLAEAFAAMVSVLLIAMGIAMLAAWAWGTAELSRSLFTMKANSAAGFFFAGCALWCLRSETAQPLRRRLGYVIAVVVGLIGALTCLEYLLHVNLRLDQLLLADPLSTGPYPGRTTVFAAIGFIFGGWALLCLNQTRRFSWVQACLAVPAMVGLITLVAYLYGANALYRFPDQDNQIALHTSLGFIGLAVGTAAARPNRGVMRFLLSDTSGGQMTRRLIVPVILVPVLLGWLHLLGEREGLFGREAGTAMVVSSLIVLMTGFVLVAGRLASCLDWRRQLAEESVRRSLEEYRATFQYAAVGKAQAAGLAGKLMEVNPAFCRMTGYTREELLGMSFHDLTHPDDRARTAQFYGQLIRGEIPAYEYEKRFVRKDGAPIWVYVSVGLARDSEGNPWRGTAVIQDITAHKAAEQRLQQEKAFSEAAVNSLPGIFYLVDQEGRLQRWNQNLELLTGYSSEEIRQLRAQDLIAPEHRAEAMAKIGDLTCVCEEPVELDLATKDGRRIPCLFTGTHFAFNNYVGLIGMGQDITEQKRAAAALRESEARFRLALKATNDVVWDWDVATNRCHWSEAILNLFGWAEALPATDLEWWKERIHPRDRPRVVASLEAALADPRRQHWDEEYQLRRSDGIYASVFDRGEMIRDETGRVLRMIGAIQDQTERKAAEQALQQAKEQLVRVNEQLERMVQTRTASLQSSLRSMEELLYSLAHDLRAPNRAMQGFASILIENYASRLGPEGLDYLRRIAAAAEQNDQLILDLLEYGRLAHVELTPARLNLEVPVRRSLRDAAPAIQRTHAEIHLPSHWPEARGSETALTQVVAQLIANALKFVAPGVVPVLKLWCETQPGKVILNLQDNGIGIPREHWSRIFQPFQRLPEAQPYPGTGMGLAIARRAVEKMDGHISVTSAPGQGSTFRLELPAA